MPSQQRSRLINPVSAAARSTNLIEPAQSAIRAIRVSGLSPLQPGRLSLSDNQLRDHVRLQLSKFGSQVTQAVHCGVRHGDVTLSGLVDNEYERSLIGQAVGRLAGIRQLCNEIEISGNQPAPVEATGSVVRWRASLWRLAAIAGVITIAAASLLLVLQFQSASAGESVAGRSAVATAGDCAGPSLCVARGHAHDCCMSLEMRQ